MAVKIESQQIQELLARALLYHWAAGLYSYPDEDGAELFWGKDSKIPLELAAAALAPEHRFGLQQALEAVWDAREASMHDADIPLSAEFIFLFAREVQAPPYEGRYRPNSGFSMGHELSDVASYYAAFGFQVSDRAKERPDHITLELEFLAALYAKEVYAIERGWGARARTTRKARVKFLQEHVVGWTEQFAALVREKSRLPFYPALSDFVCALVRGEQTP